MQPDGHVACSESNGWQTSLPTLKNPEAEKSQLAAESKFLADFMQVFKKQIKINGLIFCAPAILFAGAPPPPACGLNLCLFWNPSRRSPVCRAG
ncbi:hypothetical protein [[Pseudomonas] carboxydohydrogena]|uniref:hypothetical protein n=1 Tax=Afipia carboxydohydrogena TaxID=290 RepID=UPI0031EF1A22